MNKIKKELDFTPLTLVPNDLTGEQISCPQCFSIRYKKAGFNKQKNQQYKCKDCSRVFILNYTQKKLNVPDQCDFESDIWSPDYLGLSRLPYAKGSAHGSSGLNFSDIKQSWLKFYVKKYILQIANTKVWGSVINELQNFRSFSNFLWETDFYGDIEDIDRELIFEYVVYIRKKGLSSTAFRHRLSCLSSLFQVGTINNWFNVSPHLIRKEDYPKNYKPLPRYIPEEVLSQLNQHLDKLPEPFMRMVLIIQECGLRVGELCLLPLNCLKKDQEGKYRIQFTRWKMKKEDSLPISNELATVIQEQQQYIKDNFGTEFDYLFCSRKRAKGFHPIATVISDRSFIKILKKLAEEYQIKDSTGKVWNFQTHQFRHTVGTKMINNGVPQHIIQRYLGHESPEMTMTYAHIHDHTLRQEIEKYHESRVVNFQGESVELEHTVLSSNDDLEWFKKNVQARALENGYCARPKVLGDCDITGFDGCYDCPHWRTNKNFLPILKDTLERTNNVIEKARNCGWELQVKKNQPIQSNLQKVIASLEEGENE